MTQGIRAIVAIALVCAGSASALAGEGKRLKTKDGVIVTHYTPSNIYCIRTSSEAQAKRLGLALHATECKTRLKWAREGLTLVRKGQPESQVAAAH